MSQRLYQARTLWENISFPATNPEALREQKVAFERRAWRNLTSLPAETVHWMIETSPNIQIDWGKLVGKGHEYGEFFAGFGPRPPVPVHMLGKLPFGGKELVSQYEAMAAVGVDPRPFGKELLADAALQATVKWGGGAVLKSWMLDLPRREAYARMRPEEPYDGAADTAFTVEGEVIDKDDKPS